MGIAQGALPAASSTPAGLPEPVVETLMKVHQQPGNAVAQQLHQHMAEALALMAGTDQLEHSSRGDKAALMQTKLQLLAAKRTQIVGMRQDVDAELDKMRSQLVAFKQPNKSQDFDAIAKQVRHRFDQLDSTLAALANAQDAGSRRQALSKAMAELKAMASPANGLEAPTEALPTPTSHLGIQAKDTPLPASKALPRYLSALPVSPTQPPVAYLLDLLISGAIAAAPGTPAEASACGYAPADLAATEDAVITQDIRDLAAQLNYSPVKIFQYVYDNIRFEPYFGSLKGSQGTLYTKAGGATDQASLLIALLRASNIPARYVLGDVQIIDGSNLGANGRAPRWLGAKNYQAAANILSNNMNPSVGIGSSVIQLRHVWVEACLPYGNYRGAPSDNSGHRWLPLDPSFKDNTYQPGIGGIQQNVNFNTGATGYLATRTSTLPHEAYATLVDNYVKSLNSGQSILDVPYQGRQVPRAYDILPVSLPYEVVQYDNWAGTSSPEAAALPASHRYQFSIKVQSGNGTNLMPEQVVSLPSVAHKRITLSYTPDSASQALWNSWAGDPASVPAGAVNVLPVLKADGAVLATGAATLSLGSVHRLIMKVTLGDTTLSGSACRNDDPNIATPDPDLHCTNKTVYTNLVAGAHHALLAYARQGSDRLVAERSAQLVQAVQANPSAATPANPASYDNTEGELLHIALLKYMRYVTDSSLYLGKLNGLSGESGTHLGLTAASLKVDYLFDLPFAAHPGGTYVDVLGNQSRFVKLDSTATDSATNLNEVWPTFRLANFSNSAYEHFIWQELIRTDAVSTVRGLQFASEQGIPFNVFTSANFSNYDLLTDASMATSKNDIARYVMDGATVTAPRQTIAYSDGQAQPKVWRGAVYFVENQGKGYIAAVISGRLGGGFALNSASPVSTTYPVSSFIPSNIFTNVPVNSTTLSNGSNPLITLAGDPVNLATGNYYGSERDIALPGRGLPLVFERSYNSRSPKDGPLGFGWTHSFNHRLNFYGVESGLVKVGWLDGSGGEHFFSLAGSSVPAGTTLTASPGIYSSLRREADGSWSLTEKNGLRYSFEANASVTSGQSAKLQNIRDRNGNTLTLTYNADQTLKDITDGPGRKLSFTYAGSHISQIDVKAIGGATLASHQYGYDGNGNLVSYKSPLAVSGQHPAATYDYYGATDSQNLNHALRTYTQPQGEGMRFSYYLDGRVFQHQRHKNGNLLAETTTFRYQDFRRETVMVNERGFERRYTFDANGNPASITDESGAKTTYTYDPANPFNRLTETDANGLTLSYQYDSAANLTRMAQPSGATTTYDGFTAFNAPQRIKDATGNWTLLAYDAKGNTTDTVRLKTGKVPAASTTPAVADIAAWSKQAYDAATGLLTQSKILRVFTGASLGNFASGTGPTVAMAYDANTLYPTQVSRLGDKNGDGLINASDSADTATLAYDAQGRPNQGIDADWQATQYQYDADGRATSATDALGQVRKLAFDGNGRSIANELQVGQRLWDSAYQAYDSAGRLQTALDAGGNASQYQYDAAGNLVQMADADGYTLGFDYDPVNRWLKAYDKANHAVTRSLDATGRIRTVTDPTGATTTYSYGNASQDGRLRQVIQPAIAGFTSGIATQYTYDALGRTVKVTTVPAAGATETARDTLNTYDALGRLVRTAGPVVTDQDPSSATVGQNIRPVTRYSFDNLGNLTAIYAGQTTADGGSAINPDTGVSASDRVTLQTSYVNDDFGRRLSATDANDQITRYSYDVNGNVITLQTPNGHTLTNQWRYGHQLLSTTAEDGRRLLYTRNPLGQPTRSEAWSANPNSSLDIAYDNTYDAAHRLQTVTDRRGGKTLTYRWSPGGLLNSVQGPDTNASHYVYDPVGRLTSIWAPNFDSYGLSYDAAGRLVSLRYPNGIRKTQTWNPDGSLAQVSHQSLGGPLAQSQYRYDGLGRRNGLVETLPGPTAWTYAYQYDALDRLVQEDNSTTARLTRYSYDALNNRISRQVGPNTVVYKIDAANQLTETSLNGSLEGAYIYDAAGNLSQSCTGAPITRPSIITCSGTFTTQYTYDSLGRLAQTSGAGSANYTYDPQGRRIEVTESGVTSRNLYDGNNIVATYPGTSWTSASAYEVQAGTDFPLAKLTGNTADPTATASYYHQDGIGSVLAVTDVNQAVSASVRYEAYGRNAFLTGNFPDYGYAGRERAKTIPGLYFYRARYYWPNLGRFIQRDPIGYAAGINLYAYVGNNPVNFNDPSGLSPQSAAIRNSITPSISYYGGGNPFAFSSGAGIQVADNQVAFGQRLITQSDSTPIREGMAPASGPISPLGLGGAAVGTAATLIAPEARLVGGIAGVLGRVPVATIFRTEHYAPRLEAVGVNVGNAESAVADAIQSMRGNMVIGTDVRGRITVDNVLIEFRTRLLPDGTVNIGTIFPVAP
ncbi:MAG: DUF6531 domain-containing protein [Candidatus Paceibacterota bacterium]